MPGDNQKTEQQPDVKGATANTTRGLDQTSDLSIPNSLGDYTGIVPDEFAIVEAYRRIKRETGATEIGHCFVPLTEAQRKEFKEKVVEWRMVANIGVALKNGKKEGPEDQSLEPKANASTNTKNE